ncbi:Peptide deformylase [Candidatus Syntrophocurvum alkaliphilum]|uniref:Peptide deformylase n=1 Tax=Candidatus Syntrophocurvum alkaliphilum TaxID=2293317 RepID=A0A6I6D9S5_9FIRM|nr:peptide deformylase [Candidatus Syntrophocurvum alkaliphilum]QGT99618.1 Peptide deformylase [Candidatus Syntrophocurvum alkaliphilum]
MAVYKVVKLPEEILRTKSIPVKNINSGVIRLLDNMRDTMYAFDGVGVAAPQIGISKRIIVIDPGENYIELINPEVIEQEGEQYGVEGCLSVPGVTGVVKRAKNVVVRGLNREGNEVQIEADEMLARVLQHEIDHLDGILFIDKAQDIKREKQ